jgi:hypothetical protein
MNQEETELLTAHKQIEDTCFNLYILLLVFNFLFSINDLNYINENVPKKIYINEKKIIVICVFNSISKFLIN